MFWAATYSGGLLPIFWKLLAGVNSAYVLAQRIVFSCVFCLAVILIKKAWRRDWKDHKEQVRTAHVFPVRHTYLDKLGSVYPHGRDGQNTRSEPCVLYESAVFRAHRSDIFSRKGSAECSGRASHLPLPGSCSPSSAMARCRILQL